MKVAQAAFRNEIWIVVLSREKDSDVELKIQIFTVKSLILAQDER